jgi:seryl-tRNA synthetase
MFLEGDLLGLLRKSPDFVKDNLSKRATKFGEEVQLAYDLDQKWRKLTAQLETNRSKHNNISRKLAGGSSEELMSSAKMLKDRIIELEQEYENIRRDRDQIIERLPNLVLEAVPIGRTEEDNKIVSVNGSFKVLESDLSEFKNQTRDLTGFKIEAVKSAPIHHYQLTIDYDLADYETAAKIGGARAYFMKGKMVLLEAAATLYMLNYFFKKGFQVIVPPYLVRRWVEEGATYFEAFQETLYKIEGEDSYLIPTSEHPLAAFNSDRLFAAKDLPFRYCGYSACFRREAGAHSKDTKGMFRVHQFDKVEQYSIATVEQSEQELQELIRNSEELLEIFNIPYRKVVVCSGEMDKKATIQYDLEGWFPGQARFRELGSYGNVGAWQSHRLHIRYQDRGRKKEAHTIYGTGAPLQRFLLAFLENNVSQDGSINIPEGLVDYLPFKAITPIQAQASEYEHVSRSD